MLQIPEVVPSPPDSFEGLQKAKAQVVRQWGSQPDARSPVSVRGAAPLKIALGGEDCVLSAGFPAGGSSVSWAGVRLSKQEVEVPHRSLFIKLTRYTKWHLSDTRQLQRVHLQQFAVLPKFPGCGFSVSVSTLGQVPFLYGLCTPEARWCSLISVGQNT